MNVELWANEELIKAKTADHVQLPSDIKPGTYVMRTELLALHGNRINSMPVMGGGPQFYTHCFNVEISGNGNAVPTNTVRFPGGYKREDSGIGYKLTNKADWPNYVSLTLWFDSLKLTLAENSWTTTLQRKI